MKLSSINAARWFAASSEAILGPIMPSEDFGQVVSPLLLFLAFVLVWFCCCACLFLLLLLLLSLTLSNLTSLAF